LKVIDRGLLFSVSKFSFKKTVLKVKQNTNVYYFIVFVHQHTRPHTVV